MNITMNLTSYNGPVILDNPTFVPVRNTKELILQYCSAVDTRIVWVIGIALIMWLLQPAIFNAIDNIKYKNEFVREVFGPGNLKMMYKWIGLGLLFMSGYSLLVMS